MSYDWRKTFVKFLWISGEVIVFGLIAYFTRNGIFLAFIPALEAVRNIIKHKDDK